MIHVIYIYVCVCYMKLHDGLLKSFFQHTLRPSRPSPSCFLQLALQPGLLMAGHHKLLHADGQLGWNPMRFQEVVAHILANPQGDSRWSAMFIFMFTIITMFTFTTLSDSQATIIFWLMKLTCCNNIISYPYSSLGGSHKYPKLYGKWMIWGYPRFRTPHFVADMV